jgi:hypothetical protein
VGFVEFNGYGLGSAGHFLKNVGAWVHILCGNVRFGVNKNLEKNLKMTVFGWFLVVFRAISC